MLFNSLVFLKFLAAFLLLYALCRTDVRRRNLLIVGASYFFYGWWDYRFLGLLLGSSLVDYTVGLALGRTERQAGRRLLLAISVLTNLGILAAFKYAGFFVESAETLFRKIGIELDVRTLHIVLPVGISFYTFQSLSYSIDVYRRETQPTKNLVQFLAYVSFFPQLVAGPIERAEHLLPQFATTRVIELSMIREGLWLCLWGMFKKVVVADQLAPLVEMVYGTAVPTAPMVGLATVAFGFQIYCDFSGYSDIARGVARMVGFDLMFNFNLPYFARDIREFWGRWHISLSTWLRDYLYISLGGNRRGTARTLVNLMLTMFLGGLWHGAAWTFVVWGIWHGAGLIVHRLWMQFSGPTLPVVLGRALTVTFVFLGWTIFRAESTSQLFALIQSLTIWETPIWLGSYLRNLLALVTPLLLVEVWMARAGSQLVPLRLPHWVLAAMEGGLLFAIIAFWESEATPFVYFQF